MALNPSNGSSLEQLSLKALTTMLLNVHPVHGLNRLGLPTLELRRLQLELIFCYKIVFGLTSLTASDYFQFSNTNTRGHAYKLYMPQNSCDIRKKFTM